MTICDVVVEVDGLAGVLVHEASVDDGTILWGDEEAWPADPGERHGFLGAGEGGDEPAGGHFEVVFALGIFGDGDGETVGDDDEVLVLVDVEIGVRDSTGDRHCDSGGWREGDTDGVAWRVWPYRRPNIYFNITSPTPGTFIIALHYKGREKAILEMDLKIDDLLEKVCLNFLFPCTSSYIFVYDLQQKDNKHLLDLEYVQLNVPKVLGLLKKVFAKR